jgi:nucleoside deoxyribosyltransferase
MIEFNNQIYIAGPFFNEAQIARIQFIEQCCEKYKIPYFSPRKHAVPYDGTIEGRKFTFLSDIEGIKESKLIFASLDWLIPGGYGLHEARYCCAGYDGYAWEVGKENLNIPDPGTVWECGYTFANVLSGEKFLVGHLTEKTPNVNLMITESCMSILPSEEIIEMFLEEWSQSTTPSEQCMTIKDYERFKWEGESQ